MMSEKISEQVQNILAAPAPLMDQRMLKAFVDSFLKDRGAYLDITRRFGSPLYVFDEEVLIRRAEEFRSAFAAVLPKSRPYYAIKSNDHPYLIRLLAARGYGMDVSSGLELQKALSGGATDIIFSGPAKMPDELKLACRHSDKIVVLMDSFGELGRLQAAAEELNVTVRAGVRLSVEEKGLWRKFGIALDQLEDFMRLAGQASRIDFCGLQFHTSWNLDPSKQTDFLSRLGRTLDRLNPLSLEQIKFIDIGGGYWPKEGEWLQPGATTDGLLRKCIEPTVTEGLDHRHWPAMPIDRFALQIADHLKEHIFRHIDCRILMEPGRWVCHPAMHILLKVADHKTDDLVITDGGTNAVGWDRYETDYFPVINLSRPSLDEKECLVCGSLCTPHDLWGYAYFGESIRAGDVLLVPTQGAYTFSLRQNFIKPLPKTVIRRKSGCEAWTED